MPADEPDEADEHQPDPSDPDHALGSAPTTIDSFVRAAARAPAVGHLHEDSRLEPVDDDRYTERREIARGGMGRIVAAHDRRLDRTVAIKELHGYSEALRARFEREVLITARLQHPSIVSVLEAGRWPGGEPFFAMRLIAGQALDQAIASARSLDERLALLTHVLAVADALAYAHQEHVIHRDLKPHNVMVGTFGETVVIDWGLAKDLRAPEDPAAATAPPGPGEADPDMTALGAVIGTPSYMAPEQARGEAVDERADVYALGAILYHLLAGAPPYGGATRSVLEEVIAGPPPPLADIAQGAPRELITITQRAMARAPEERYRTAAALTADLRAFLTGQLVSAHHYGAIETMRRWMRRHRNAIVVGVVLVTALAVTATLAVRGITRERDRATTALASLRARDGELAQRQAESLLDIDPTAAIAWVKRASDAPAATWRARALAEVAISRGVARHVTALDGAATLMVGDGDRVLLADDGGGLWSWDGGAGVTAVARGTRPAAIALDGTRAIVADQDGKLRAFDLTTGAATLLRHGAVMRAVVVAPDGGVWTGDVDGVVRRTHGGATQEVARLAGAVAAIAVLDDRRWATGFDDGTVVIADPAGGPPRHAQVHTREVGDLVFADEHALISVAEDGLVVAWDPATGAHRELGRHDEWVSALALSPDRRQIATGSADSTIRIWSLDGAPPRVLQGHTGTVWALAWAPDGRLASGANDGLIRVWSSRFDDVAIPTGQPVRRLAWARGGVVAAMARTARVYTAVPSPPLVLAGGGDQTVDVSVSPSGGRVVAGGRGRRARVWDLATAAPIADQTLDGWITGVGFSDEDHVVVVSETQAIVLDLAAPSARAPLATDLGTSLAVPFDDGAHVVWIDSQTGGALVADLRSGQTRTVGDGQLTAAIPVPSSSAIVTGAHGGEVALWPLVGGASRVLGAVPTAVLGLGVSPDERWVVAFPVSGPGQAWPMSGGAGRAIPELDGAATIVLGPDDRLVSAVGPDIVVVDLGTGHSRRLLGHRANLWRLMLSRDGERLVSVDVDGEVRTWRTSDGASAVVRSGRGRRCEVAWVGLDRVAISVGDEIHVVTLPTDVAVHDDLRAWLEAVSSVAIDVR